MTEEQIKGLEVGDIVRIVYDPLTDTVYGSGCAIFGVNETLAEVICRADDAGDVRVKTKSNKYLINIHCLELVRKAVKDKYFVSEGEEVVYVGFGDDGKLMHVVAAFTKQLHPNAKAAVEAECARLNAEWRKRQEGGTE